MSDLQILHVTLRNLDGQLPIQAVRLRPLDGVFYTALGGKASPLARSIHSIGAAGRPNPAPYSIGPLFADGYLKGLRIATLQDYTQSKFNLAQVTAEAWDKLKGKVIQVGSANMEVIEAAVESQSTYNQVWAESEPHHGLELRFDMPTRFPLYGRDGLLPIPQAIWQCYLLRWNAFSGMAKEIPLEFLTWVQHLVHGVNVTLETGLAPIEREETASGVMGNVTYQAFREKKPPKGKDYVMPESQLPRYLRAWQALAALAEYCGTGMNADIGMGRTRVVSRFGPYRAPQDS